MKVLIITIALGQYTKFLPRFIMTCKKLFLPDVEKQFLIITDQDIEDIASYKIPIHVSKQEKLGWPHDTLKRFHYFCAEEELISKFDYSFYFDSDMAFNSKITPEEFLPTGEQNLLGVQHPAFFNNENGTFDRNPMSTAYIEEAHKGPYYQGCVLGGEKLAFYSMIHHLKKDVDNNYSRDIIALWHDESHLNQYFRMKDYVAKEKRKESPIKMLHPGFAYPERWDLPFEKKIIHLAKDNEEIRK